MARIGSMAQELPNAMGGTIKKKKKNGKSPLHLVNG